VVSHHPRLFRARPAQQSSVLAAAPWYGTQALRQVCCWLSEVEPQ
jgi:hypothetical protein